MTAPVEFEFRNLSASRSYFGSFNVGWVMTFLYRSPEEGSTGAESNVVIRDTEEITVISVGLEGAFSYSLVNEGADIL